MLSVNQKGIVRGNEHVDHVTKWADGPVYFDVMKPRDAKRVRYQSRDLVLEAFEDGHPHCIHP
jgi:hypothetical protein